LSLAVRTRDGIGLRVISRGDLRTDRIPFLLVHGLASNARLWDGVGDALAAAGHGNVAVDQRGHGESDKVDGFDFPTLCDDLASVVAATVGAPVIAAGQSWGGNVVLELAARRPDLVAGVVCVDGGFIKVSEAFPEWEAAQRTLAPPSVTGMTRAQLAALIRSGLAGFPEEGISAQLANFEELPDGTVRARLSRDRHMTILRFLWEHDPDALADRVAQPVLVIATEGGVPGKDGRVASFTGRLARGSAVWMDAHHDVHAQHPETVGALLVDFAASVRGAGA
jgi:pimeloyl-ACP methyl ester carboxylesterase